MSNSLVQRLLKSLKKSAKVIETAADVVEWPEIELTRYPDSTVLVFDLKDLDTSELELSHNDHLVKLEIRPDCPDYLIPSLSRLPHHGPEHLAFWNKHRHTRWSTCTVKELHSFFHDWLFVKDADFGNGMWKARILDMVRAILPQVISMRDEGKCTLTAALFRKHLLLDSYVSLLKEENWNQPLLVDYLNSLPEFSMEDAQTGNISPKAYEQHDFLTSQVSDALAVDQVDRHDGQVRRPERSIECPLTNLILSAEATLVGSRLEITVKHHSKEFVRLKWKA